MPVLSQLAASNQGDRYFHWDELRHRPAPQGLSHEQWWLAEKLSRRGTGTPLPLLSSAGSPFWFCQPPLLLKGLHEIDRKAGASVMAPEAVTLIARHKSENRCDRTGLRSMGGQGAMRTWGYDTNPIPSGIPCPAPC